VRPPPQTNRIRIEPGTLQLEPAFPAGACRRRQQQQLPAAQEASAGSSSVEGQDAQLGDLFGLEAPAQPVPLLGFDAGVSNLDLSSFNPENIRQRHPQLGEKWSAALKATAGWVTRWHACLPAYRFGSGTASLGEAGCLFPL